MNRLHLQKKYTRRFSGLLSGALLVIALFSSLFFVVFLPSSSYADNKDKSLVKELKDRLNSDTAKSYWAKRRAEYRARRISDTSPLVRVPSAARKIIEKAKKLGITRANARFKQAKKTLSNPLVHINDDGYIHLYLVVDDVTPGLLAALEAKDVRIKIANKKYHLISGWVPLESVEDVLAVSGVKRIKLPGYGFTRTGSVQTEGDTFLKTNEVRNLFSNTGVGIKVGVISDGDGGLAASQVTGDLPASVQVLNPGAGAEGTAMMEIVHDVAPGANLLFYGVSPILPLGMVTAIDSLVTSGAQIIVDDLGFFTEPYFEDGMVALEAHAAVADSGVFYASAAGNEVQVHYEGVFVDSGVFHDATNAHSFGGRPWTQVTVGAGLWGGVTLQWKNQFGASSDNYDIYIYNYDSSTLVASSTNLQNGTQNPLENVTWQNTSGVDSQYIIVIDKFSGNAQPLEFFVDPSSTTLDLDNVLDSSVFGHPGDSRVFAVGASLWSDSTNVENFSSHGPSEVAFPVPEIRAKPDAVGPDGVSVTGVGGFGSPFFGTSAAAPHIAGVAALLLSAELNLVPDSISNALRNTAFDILTAGFDTASGAGRVDGLSALISIDVTPPSTFILSSPQNGAETNLTSITFRWTDAIDSWISINYRLIVDTDFAGSYVVDTTVSETFVTVTIPGSDTYYWRVIASDAGGNTTQVGDFTIIVDTLPPSVPVLSSPVNGVTLVSGIINLDWSDVTDTHSGLGYYLVEVDSDINFGSPDFTGTESIASGTTINLGITDTYYWRVFAYDDAGNTSVSLTDSFVLLIDTPVVTITAPANGTNTSAPVISVQGTVTDLYDTPSEVTVSFPGGSDTFSVANGLFSGTITLGVQGANTITVSGTNTSGNNGFDTVVINFNTQPVLVFITGPTTSDTYDTRISPINISGTTTGLFDGDTAFLYVGGAPTDTVNVFSDSFVFNNVNLTYFYDSYSIKVLNTFDSEAWDTIAITYDTMPPGTATLISPVSGESVTTISISFDWSDATDTHSGLAYYVVQIDSDINFASPDFTGTVADTSGTTVMLTGNDTYYWRVFAYDNAGNTSVSLTDSFVLIITDTLPPSVFNLLSPANAVTTDSPLVTFQWETSTDDTSPPVSYRLQIDTESTFAGLIYDTFWLSDTTVTYPLPNSDTFYWRVIAIDNAGNTRASTGSWYLIITAAISVNSISTISDTTLSNLGNDTFIIYVVLTNPYSYTVDISADTSLDLILTNGLGADVTSQFNIDFFLNPDTLPANSTETVAYIITVPDSTNNIVLGSLHINVNNARPQILDLTTGDNLSDPNGGSGYTAVIYTPVSMTSGGALLGADNITQADIPAGAFPVGTNFSIVLDPTDASIAAANNAADQDITINSYASLDDSVVEFLADRSASAPANNTILLTLSYNDASVPAQYEPYIRIYYLNPSAQRWVTGAPYVVHRSVDTVNNTVSGFVGHFSIYRAMIALTAAENLDDVYVYPNPFVPDDGDPNTGLTYNGALNTGVTFMGLTLNSKIRIFSIAGELIDEVDVTTGQGNWQWDVKNKYGNDISGGMYLYLITNNKNEKAVGKIVIIK